MAKNHSARQQKRMAKHKAKRTVKRSLWSRLNSTDPAIRLQNVEKLTVVQTLMGSRLWDDGIGHLTIARQESTGGVIFAVFLVDVYCLGVKNAFCALAPEQNSRSLSGIWTNRRKCPRSLQLVW